VTPFFWPLCRPVPASPRRAIARQAAGWASYMRMERAWRGRGGQHSADARIAAHHRATEPCTDGQARLRPWLSPLRVEMHANNEPSAAALRLALPSRHLSPAHGDQGRNRDTAGSRCWTGSAARKRAFEACLRGELRRQGRQRQRLDNCKRASDEAWCRSAIACLDGAAPTLRFRWLSESHVIEHGIFKRSERSGVAATRSFDISAWVKYWYLPRRSPHLDKFNLRRHLHRLRRRSSGPSGPRLAGAQLNSRRSRGAQEIERGATHLSHRQSRASARHRIAGQ